jgi:electron transport complex protein RnfB
MKTFKLTVEQIENELPQTQCKLCTYEGCKPYAEAIVNEGDAINRCLPGGVRGLKKLAELTDQDATPFVEQMQQEEKPKMLAVIREAECIGCTKCIQACPVDAILGSGKLMHTVIAHECTGCELCVEPCPVDCIDMIELGSVEETDPREEKKKAKHYKQRYEFRNERLERDKILARKKHKQAKVADVASKVDSLEMRKKLIAEAVARAKAKRNE